MKKTSSILSLVVLMSTAITPSAMASQLKAPVLMASNTNAYRSMDQIDLQGTYLTEKIMTKDTAKKTIELERSGLLTLANEVQVYQLSGDSLVPKSLADVRVGAENVRVYVNGQDQVKLLILEGETRVDRMRIGLFNSGFGSLDHASFQAKSADGLLLIDKKTNQQYEVAPDQSVSITNQGNTLTVSVNNQTLVSMSERLYVVPAATNGMTEVLSLNRAQGTPKYRGMLEIKPSTSNGKLSVINELLLEQYLYQVVPSEMPASFGQEALKAQAIAARTYALSDYYSNRYAAKGFHVDDSTMSQVYNNTPENATVTKAIEETTGLVMKYQNELVDARYYSSSSGVGAGRHEIWPDTVTQQFPGSSVPYLIPQSFLMESQKKAKFMPITIASEEDMLSFVKNLSVISVDSQSPFFRWKVELSKGELQNTINKNLAARAAADPNGVYISQGDGEFVKGAIPSNGVGELYNLHVSKRGENGNIQELILEGSNGTFKVVKDYNVRYLLRPTKTYTGGGDVILHRTSGDSSQYDAKQAMKNYSLLPSGFVAFEVSQDEKGNLQSVTIYGGGNGHGVGMSQYGASTLDKLGLPVEQILQTFYPNHQLVNLYQS
ncbi:SpoIID/LytB domain-containing protein [Brevibacillus laterosporus]|uniref:SpoIID/LytB domain-containing protein n=1 Tax=Brevibacillus laterosporus TaxID=1465 RepID=A0A518VBV4_BRELA|nr:SpoIID/LytB domain-containing protein [Brevibacillus laterosporus]